MRHDCPFLLATIDSVLALSTVVGLLHAVLLHCHGAIVFCRVLVFVSLDTPVMVRRAMKSITVW